jgi:hypothetical protein
VEDNLNKKEKMKNIKNIKSISFALLKKEYDIKDNKASFIKKKNAKFVIPINFNRNLFSELCDVIYWDLLSEAPKDIDYLGLWVEYNNNDILENSISLESLKNMQAYSIDKQIIKPAYEFFKMTIEKK